jgi:hypothetical protein
MAERSFRVLVYRQGAQERERARAADLDFSVTASSVDRAAVLVRAGLEARHLAVRAVNHAPDDVIRATVFGPRTGAPATIVAQLHTAKARVR